METDNIKTASKHLSQTIKLYSRRSWLRKMGLVEAVNIMNDKTVLTNRNKTVLTNRQAGLQIDLFAFHTWLRNMGLIETRNIIYSADILNE